MSVLDNEDAEQMGKLQVKGLCSLQNLLSVKILQKWVQRKDQIIQPGNWDQWRRISGWPGSLVGWKLQMYGMTRAP